MNPRLRTFLLVALCGGAFVWGLLRVLRAPKEPAVSPAAEPGRVLKRWQPELTSQAPYRSAEARTIQVGDETRRYIASTPTRPTRAIVLVLHGDGGSAASFKSAMHFEEAAEGAAHILHLDGQGSTWDHHTRVGNADVAFVEALIARTIQEHNLQAALVFGSAYSSGGFFLQMLACERPGFLRAMATSAAGGPYERGSKYANGYERCEGQKPTPMMALHGTSDFSVPFAGGRFSAMYWAFVNGCDGSSMETTAYPECNAYRSCPNRNEVVFCKIDGLGHWIWDESAKASWSFFRTYL
jgi:polyhydroxybutyrate depolymerase